MPKNLSKIIVIFFVFLLALGLRLYLLPKPGFTSDIRLFLYWGQRIENEGLASVYNKNSYSQGVDYPFLIPLATSYLTRVTGDSPPSEQDLLFKIIPTLAELILVSVCAYLIMRSKIKYKWPLVILVIIQPALALVTSGWGQVDSILSLLILLAFLLIDKNNFLATFVIFLSLLVKPQAIPAVLIFFLFLVSKRKWLELVKQVLFFIFLFSVLIIVFKFFAGANLLDPYIKSVGRYENLSLNAFNFWWAIFGRNAWEITDSIQSGITYRQEGFLLLAVFFIPVLTYLMGRKRSFEEAILALSYTYLIFFIFPTEIHERYLYPAVVFFSIASLLDKKIFLSYLFLSATFLVNVFAVLQTYYPQFAFLRLDLLEGGWTRVPAIVNVAIAIFISVFLIFESYKTVKVRSEEE